MCPVAVGITRKLAEETHRFGFSILCYIPWVKATLMTGLQVAALVEKPFH